MTTDKNPMILNPNLLNRFCRGLDEQYLKLPLQEALALKNILITPLQESQDKDSLEVALRFCKFFPDNPEFQEETKQLEKLLSRLEVSI